MMLIDLKRILDETGYPVAYSQFKPTPIKPMPSPPYIVYVVAYSSNFIADNRVFKKTDNVQVELYTTNKDLTAENILETVFDNHEIAYESTETYIESEELYQKIYEVRLI